MSSQPFIALFLAIGLGYAAGNIKVAGFNLGVGAVLFVGLLIGVIAPKSAPPGFVGVLGLILFMYGIGIQYGVDFFRGLVSLAGIKANALALVAVATVMARMPTGVELVGLRRGGTNMLPRPERVFAEQDVLVVAGYPEAIAKLEGLSSERTAPSRASRISPRVAHLQTKSGCHREPLWHPRSIGFSGEP